MRRPLERRAYAAIERVSAGALGKIRAHDGAPAQGQTRTVERAARVRRIERFDEFEAAMDTLRGALECVDIAHR